MMKVHAFPPSNPSARSNRHFPVAGFSILEILVATVILVLVLATLASLMNMTTSFYQRTMGRLDSFETARAAFDTMSRTLRQTTLLSHLGYDDPLEPTSYELKSDLHFFSGRQEDLGFEGGEEALNDSHAVFFQAPMGVAEEEELRGGALLGATGFFIAYGDDPMRPPILDGRIEERQRYRLYQFIEPREDMNVYERTIQDDGIPISNEGYEGTEWFSEAVNAWFMDPADTENSGRAVHPLAENVVAMAILPVHEEAPWGYHWNSRDSEVYETHNRLPQAVHLVLAVIDEKSAARLENAAALDLVPAETEALFTDPAEFEDDVEGLEKALAEHDPPLNYRIFRTLIPLNVSNTRL